MAALIIAQININDRERYAEYEAGFMQIFERFEGKMIAVDEAVQALEGDWDYTRTVVIEFPSRQAALDWYHSDDYQQLAQHRFAASHANIGLVATMGQN